MPFPSELEILIRARYPILYILTNEELRAQGVVEEIARKRQKKLFEWSCTTGIVPCGTSIQSQKTRNGATRDPLAALDQVIEMVEPIIFISPVMEIPAELEKEITLLNYPLPSREDLSELLDRIMADVSQFKQVDLDLDDTSRDRLLQAALGLTLSEAENVFAKIIVKQ